MHSSRMEETSEATREHIQAFGGFRSPEAPTALGMRSSAASEGSKVLRRLYGGPPKIARSEAPTQLLRRSV
ncbi:hypothetical protein CROQUDRAFT_92318 [Cronartium quercuum f. sp. fusiforme G11]|uniref:Uncharacterized protein n=1 Tax=Cronartium quercuum f. sp. fusiforme G11 TaxID=708437 RepID=A0A9P6NGS5_9BASI|nr:hypothetical protein CROQUDRAFT_92318 [Cronartium quercuum f. sp. fusiforme G11]